MFPLGSPRTGLRSTVSRRRHRRPRRIAATLFVLALVAWVGWTVHQTMRKADMLGLAGRLLDGNPAADVAPDPRGAIEVLTQSLSHDPDDFDVLVLRSRAWARLRAWDKASGDAERAFQVAEAANDQIRALRIRMDYLINAGDYDGAVDVGERMVEIDGQPLRRFLLGTAYYKGSTAAQEDALRFFESTVTTARELEVAERVEEYVTTLIGEPDVEGLLTWMLPDSDPVLARRVRESLTDSRARYLEAFELLDDYRYHEGYDHATARAYCEIMLRSGRMFEAFLEADISLREPSLPPPMITFFEETKATVLERIGDHAGAADRYEQVIDVSMEGGRRVSPFLVSDLYENRIEAEQWAWVLDRAGDDMRRFGEHKVVLLARAKALAAAGKTSEALAIVEPMFATLVNGTANLLPPYLRASPRLRREVVVTAYELFAANDDRNALSALEWILAEFPDDRDARRWRIEHIVEHHGNDLTRLEVAVEDAFALMRGAHRDRADFDRWLELSDRHSELRTGNAILQRASASVDQAEAWAAKVAEAQFTRATAGGRIEPVDEFGAAAVRLYHPDLPALSVAIALEMIEEGLLSEARNQCRRLVEQFPDVPQFRFVLARLLVREGRLEAALVEFERILRDVPSDTESLDYATRTLVALGRHEDAADLVNQMILDDPEGVGAERYAMRLLAKGHPDEVDNLVDRLRRQSDGEITPSMLLLSTRAALARGDHDTARAQLTTLVELFPKSLDVALIALELGVAIDTQSLVNFALGELDLLAPGLFPDQMRSVPELMISLGLPEQLLAIFDDDVRDLPAARPALRPLAAAAKSLGRLDEADELLARLEGEATLLGDREVVLDRFLLTALRGDVVAAAHRLRLDSVRPEIRDTVDVCLLVAAALRRHASLLDNVPTQRLDTLGLDDRLPPRELELADALLRIAPHVERLGDVLPRAVVEAPATVYAHASRDVARLVELAAESPQLAGEIVDSMLLLLMMNDRPFWADERRFLAERLRTVVPSLGYPARVLAEAYLEADRPEDALATIEPMMDEELIDPDVLEVFIDAAYAYGKGEWGVAVALLLQEPPDDGGEAAPPGEEPGEEPGEADEPDVVADDDSADAGGAPSRVARAKTRGETSPPAPEPDGPHLDMRLVLAESLLERDNAREALPLFRSYLVVRPDDARALRGVIAAYGEERQLGAALAQMRHAFTLHPYDAALADASIEILTPLFQPSDDAIEVMEWLLERWPDDPRVPEALARAANGDPERVEELLQLMLTAMDADPVALDSDEAQLRSGLLVRASRTARVNGLIDTAYDLTRRALRFDPGSLIHLHELALLELEIGNIDRARRYFEALRVIDTKDREAAMTLAQLYFEEIGEPMRAAEVVDATFLGNMPPEATLILAARTYMQGDGPGAIAEFTSIIGSPLITEYTMMAVGRIAYAAGEDEAARSLFEQVISRVDEDHELWGRAQYLAGRRL